MRIISSSKGVNCVYCTAEYLFEMFLNVHLCVSPALSQRHFEQRFGQAQLLLPHSVGQHLSVRVVSVGLVAQLEQLPDCHTQRPETQHGHCVNET